MSENCLFCRIIKRDIPGNIIDENEMVLASYYQGPNATKKNKLERKDVKGYVNDILARYKKLAGR